MAASPAGLVLQASTIVNQIEETRALLAPGQIWPSRIRQTELLLATEHAVATLQMLELGVRFVSVLHPQPLVFYVVLFPKFTARRQGKR